MAVRTFVVARVIFLLFLLYGHVAPVAVSSNSKERLLLISFDGFRWNYLNRTDTPNFDRITRNGVRAVHGLKNAFITKTFPNHFTLVTGQWEEDHSIVANYMYDPVLNSSFSPHNAKANTDPAWFDQGGEPIWVTNQLQRTDGRTGVIMWVGGGAPVKNVLPTKFMPFDQDKKYKVKIDTMVKWFKNGFNLGLIYFDQPDKFGHLYGPESEEVTQMIGKLDTVVGYLLDSLKEVKLLDTTNIIITSDHGFTSTPEDKAINLADIIDEERFLLESSTPVAGIWPHPGFHDVIYENLTAAAKAMGHFTVYQKGDIPAHFHYTHNRRIPPIIAVAEDHYSFTSGYPPQKGNHGYDNRLQDMHPFFVAMGPAFKSGFTVDTFESVDVYPLMCHILGLKPASNNGSMEVVGTLLVSKTSEGKESFLKTLKKNHFGSILVTCFISIGLTAAACIVFNEVRKKRNRERESLQVIMNDVTTATEEKEIDNSKTPLLHDQDF